MEIRPAVEADLSAAHAVFRRSIEDLYERHRFEPPRPPQDVFVRQHAHLLEHDADRFWVAAAEGRLVGFSAALVREDAWFLSALFVSPEHQAGGVGKELLARVWEGDSDVRHRLTIVDAIQPVSTGLYSRAGLLPVTPLMNLAGEPRARTEPRPRTRAARRGSPSRAGPSCIRLRPRTRSLVLARRRRAGRSGRSRARRSPTRIGGRVDVLDPSQGERLRPADKRSRRNWSAPEDAS